MEQKASLFAVCACSAVSRVGRRPGPVSAVSGREAEPVPGTVASEMDQGLTFPDCYVSRKPE